MKKIKYTELAMDDIHPEARNIAVAWIENYQPNNSIMPEIAQKVKLASDIMNFAIAYHEHQTEQLKQHGVMQAEGSDVSEGAAVASEGEEKCVCGGFDEGYKRGYQDATSEAIEEIHKNYKPRA